VVSVVTATQDRDRTAMVPADIMDTTLDTSDIMSVMHMVDTAIMHRTTSATDITR
jgi:hypothetical protein